MSDQPMKYCDLVMKGGITSGIVYPNAVLALSREYRFKNIGGTSAGAIAAAACAAAAVGDRHAAAAPTLEAETLGFAGLKTVAAKLAKADFIFGLFQPASGARNAYRTLVILTGTAARWRKILALALAVPTIAPIEFVLILLALFGVGYAWAGWLGAEAAALPTLLCAYVGGALFALFRIARVMRRNLLGLCSGIGVSRWWRKPKPGLTEWLHQVLHELSGKPAGEPLLFRDLWNAPRYPDEPRSPEAVTLRMITSSLSHHEPRSLPFESRTFWFREDEFVRLFPEDVVAWMVTNAKAICTVEGIDYHQLQAAGDMPVLVAMRMSLSFPLLISAVPLHEPAKRQRATAQAEASPPAPDQSEAPALDSTEALAASGPVVVTDIIEFRICWFSDGGISSNFPIHLFDAPLPQWPTFAINLVYPKTADNPGQPVIFLPTENNQGWQRKYQSFAKPWAASELLGFAGAIIATMQNWRDLLQARAPGHRDRIVHVSLAGDEGGMNLKMPQPTLDTIVAKGVAAGEAFGEFSFANHHWVRWRNLASALQRYTIRTAEGMTGEPKIPAYAAAFETASTGEPPPPSYKFRSEEQRRAAEELLAHLVEQGLAWEDLGPDLTAGAPRPLPHLQITPTY